MLWASVKLCESSVAPTNFLFPMSLEYAISIIKYNIFRPSP